ncbi:hypothetical protein [Ascidiimonas sp. W6]|uniref:hypothetical protein n=1 Tax=Ascidiimonas meishanensis TaxID=3128903 RepID=UPI0030EED2FC
MHANKSQENKDQLTSNVFPKHKFSADQPSFQFQDHGVHAVTQRKLQELADKSMQTNQLKSIQETANGRLFQQQALTSQMKAKVHVNDKPTLEKEADVMGAKAATLIQSKSSELTSSPLNTATDKQPLQRKIKIVNGATYTDGAELPEEVVNKESLAGVLGNAGVFELKSIPDLAKLANNEKVDVLTPAKHVIGEKHTDSKFNEIVAAWPGVSHMGEGQYMIHETDLNLPAPPKPVTAQNTLDVNMNSQGSAMLPLENFHTAAYARLVAYLVIVNSQQHEKSDNSTRYIKSRAQDLLNAVRAYTNVGVGAFLRAKEDEKFYHIWTPYKRNIEKYYGNIFNQLQTANDKAATLTLENLVGGTLNPDNITSKQLTEIRKMIKGIIPMISIILKESVKGEDTQPDVNTESAKIDTHVKNQGDGLRGKDMQTSLDVVNPLREVYMKKQIATLAMPGLVKVGDAHLAGLIKIGVPNAIYYADYNKFYQEIQKQIGDL